MFKKLLRFFSSKKELTKEQEEATCKILGFYGRLLSGSKRPIKGNDGFQFIIWNANLVVENYGKIWYGDINITTQEYDLMLISKIFGNRKVYVLYEMDGRFENEASPKMDRAVYITDGKTGTVGKEVEKYYGRKQQSGRITLKPEYDYLYEERSC